MKSIFTLVLLITSTLFIQAQNFEPEYPKTIPTFQFAKIKGDGIFDSKEIKKNKQTLIGFVSPECIHCVLSIQHLYNNYKKLENINLIFVTEYEKEVFTNKVKTIAPDFFNNNQIQILQDTEGEFIEKFKPLTLPTFYLFDKKGNLETVKRGSIEINQIFQFIQ